MPIQRNKTFIFYFNIRVETDKYKVAEFCTIWSILDHNDQQKMSAEKSYDMKVLISLIQCFYQDLGFCFLDFCEFCHIFFLTDFYIYYILRIKLNPK